MKKIIVIITGIMLMASIHPAVAQDGKKKKTETAKISASMHCRACADNIELKLNFEPGVKKVTADPVSKIVEVEYMPKKTNPDKLAARIRDLGYSASVIVE